MANPQIRTVIPGHDAACSINGVMFGVRRSKLTNFAETVQVGDSEDQSTDISGKEVIFIKERAGRRQAIISFDFYEDRNLFPWTGNLLLKDGNVVAVNFWRSFATDQPWVFPRVVLAHYEEVQHIDRWLEGALAGKSDGKFFYPGEVQN